MTRRLTTSVVIPTINAEQYLSSLFEAFDHQKPHVPDEIIIIDSQSTDRTEELARSHTGVIFQTIERFSHGGARNQGARIATGDIVVYLSQDALPKGDVWLAELIQPFADSVVGACYSRQVPKADANPMEQFFLLKRFPPGEMVIQRKMDNTPLTLEQVFFSNVSAAVRRSVLLDHPFDEQIIMSEDQKLSLDLMEADYSVVYQPASQVLHSHNYTLSVAFKRYFDSVYSLSVIFPSHGIATSVKMGRSYTLEEIKFIFRNHPRWLLYYCLYTGAKVFGTILSHCADWLPRWVLRRVSLHRYYWEDPQP